MNKIYLKRAVIALKVIGFLPLIVLHDVFWSVIAGIKLIIQDIQDNFTDRYPFRFNAYKYLQGVKKAWEAVE